VIKSPHVRWIAIRLAAITAMPLALYAARIVYTGKIAYRFLPWNLFLAWLPIFRYPSIGVGPGGDSPIISQICCWTGRNFGKWMSS